MNIVAYLVLMIRIYHQVVGFDTNQRLNNPMSVAIIAKVALERRRAGPILLQQPPAAREARGRGERRSARRAATNRRFRAPKRGGAASHLA